MCMASKCSDGVPEAGVALASEGAAAAGGPVVVVPAAGDGNGTPAAARKFVTRASCHHSQFTA
jgi:hypothetical protein